MSELPEMTVHLHAFAALPDGSQETVFDEDDADGFCTFIRTATPDDPQQPFNITREEDHETLDDAIGRAEALALMIRRDPNDYHRL